MKSLKFISYIVFSFVLLTNCGKEASKSAENQEEEHGHEEAATTVATLTEDQMKAIDLKLGTIEQKELTATIKANGFLQVPNSSKASVAAMFGGIIKTLNIQEGDLVKKGQVIATISNPEYVLTQEQYLTVLSKITYAEQEEKRQNELFENGAGAKKNLQSASAELKTLRTQKASLVRQLQMMGINPAKVTNANLQNGMAITAPIAGTVSKISAQIGSYVDVSTPVAEIIDNNSIHLDLQIFEKDLSKIKIGQVIHFQLTNNPEVQYDAEIYSIGSSFENQSKSISVHSKVIGNKTGLIDGMNITGIVSLSNTLTPAVVNEAIVEADGKFFIFVQTNKSADAHAETAAHDNHDHSHDEGAEAHNHENGTQTTKTMNFEKVEVVKGATNMGYTAITPVIEIPANTKIAVKGAYFINAKMSNNGGHHH